MGEHRRTGSGVQSRLLPSDHRNNVAYGVLVVEDEDDAALLTQTQLQTADIRFDVSRVHTREQALAAVRADPGIDAVILDLTLPDARHDEALRDLVRLAPSAAVVVLTGSAETSAVPLLRAGASSFLLKNETDSDRLARTVVFAVERKIYEDRLRAITDTDVLTGLGNRRRLDHAMVSMRARRHRVGGTIGLAVVDIDGLDHVNLLYGHSVGDQVLKTTAAALDRVTRAEECVARIGGDEFAVLVLDQSDRHMHAVVDRLHARVIAALDTTSGGATVSIGAATTRTDDIGLDELLGHARAAVEDSAPGQRRIVALDPPIGSS